MLATCSPSDHVWQFFTSVCHCITPTTTSPASISGVLAVCQLTTKSAFLLPQHSNGRYQFLHPSKQLGSGAVTNNFQILDDLTREKMTSRSRCSERVGSSQWLSVRAMESQLSTAWDGCRGRKKGMCRVTCWNETHSRRSHFASYVSGLSPMCESFLVGVPEHPVPVNATFFGSRVFTKTIKYKCSPQGGPSPTMSGVLLHRENVGRQMCKEGRGCENTGRRRSTSHGLLEAGRS